jgi:hypothetical protein
LLKLLKGRLTERDDSVQSNKEIHQSLLESKGQFMGLTTMAPDLAMGYADKLSAVFEARSVEVLNNAKKPHRSIDWKRIEGVEAAYAKGETRPWQRPLLRKNVPQTMPQVLARSSSHWLRLFALFAALLLPGQSPAQEPDALERLNKAFRDAHAKSRTIVLEQSGPIIIVDFEKLTLLQNKSRIEADVIPPLYQHLKAVAHSPMAVYLTIAPFRAERLTVDQMTEVLQLRDLVKKAMNAIPNKGFSKTQLDRQRQILNQCQDFLAQVADARVCSSQDLIAFARKTQPLILANADEAAQIQIEAYDSKLAEWRRKLSPIDWAKLRVVIMGSALPRRDNLAVQFFAKILGEPGEGKRIFYAEALFDEPKALRLLAASDVDSAAALAFFDDPLRLHRDLLAEAATKYLKDNGNRLKVLAPDGK